MNVPSAPVGVVSITVPERGDESEVLDRFEAACDDPGYNGSVIVICNSKRDPQQSHTSAGSSASSLSSSWSDIALDKGQWEVSGSCERIDWYCTNVPSAPVGVSSPIAVPGYGNESEVLDWFEVACDEHGYEGSVTVTCAAGEGSAVSGGGGEWKVSGACE